jgi:hypothetical protein
MADYKSAMANPGNISEEEQKRVGQAFGGDMSVRHKEFVKKLSDMIAKGEIDPLHTETFVNEDVYARIDDALRMKVDLTLPNIATLLTHIVEFYRSKQTPDACAQLATMIDQLWEMKERIEKFADVFKF